MTYKSIKQTSRVSKNAKEISEARQQKNETETDKKKETFARLQLMENTHNIINATKTERKRKRRQVRRNNCKQFPIHTQRKGRPKEKGKKQGTQARRERESEPRKILWELSMQ